MQKTTKVIVTIVAIVLFIIFFGALVGSRTDAGQSTPGFLSLILFAALVGGLRAIWKKDTDENNGNNSSTLQK